MSAAYAPPVDVVSSTPARRGCVMRGPKHGTVYT